MTLSVSDGIAIQEEQLEKLVLKKKTFKALVEYAKKDNDKAKDGFDITRGSDLSTFVNNHAIDLYWKKLEKKVKPTRLQNGWIKKARKYLIGDYTDSQILNVIGNIRDNQDQNQLIDYIDEVQVWEKVEFEFTCKEFLELVGYK